jgi:hypothetical protein
VELRDQVEVAVEEMAAAVLVILRLRLAALILAVVEVDVNLLELVVLGVRAL